MPRFVLFALLVCLSICGCGDSGAPILPCAPVSGHLTFQGKPLAHYRVTFFPPDGGRPGSGVTDESGKFILSTNSDGDGAPPGLNKVSIVWEGPTGDGTDAPIEDPRKYPKPDIQLPAKYTDPEKSEIKQEVPPDGLEDVKIDLK